MTQSPPPTQAVFAREDHGRPFPLPYPLAQHYLVLEFPILKEPQLILTLQIVSINVTEVYLWIERGSLRSPGFWPTVDDMCVPN